MYVVLDVRKCGEVRGLRFEVYIATKQQEENENFKPGFIHSCIIRPCIFGYLDSIYKIAG